MNRLQIYMSALAAANATLNISDPAQVDVSAAQAFQAQKMNDADYALWKNYFTAARNNMLSLQKQQAPSALLKPAPTAPAA
jgi:hypothetical protein